jgi:hypothetical protein
MVQIVARLTASSWRFAWWVASHTHRVAPSSVAGDAERASRSAFCQWNALERRSGHGERQRRRHRDRHLTAQQRAETAAHRLKLPCRKLTVFVFFSSRLGCLGSLLVSAIGTIVILIILDVI